ncbi:hypothetical protein [Parasulfitobacter algicola]|uniref:Uncharacterized protein n=1 Tax=Parasulfitobacter algicola TaxID=2614809 RepID=A0ABX2IY91_9RHOB|nr:hypothetical protein [Sulfitobacter algicola]NSX55423.1 hypothetical protein [Sulfitobacter algicola]
MKANRIKTRGPDGHADPDNPLYDVVQDAYRVFAASEPPETVGACDCCMEPNIKADFFNHGQRDLPFHYLKDWFFAAVDDTFSKRTWSYLLPRVFDALAAREDVSSVGNEVALSKFPTGKREHWSDEEWDVIDRFQRLYLETQVGRTYDIYDEKYRLDDVLSIFGYAQWDATSLFDQVFQWPTDQLAKQLWSDWCELGKPGVWINSFWPDASVPYEHYTSQSLYDRMVAFGMDEVNEKEIAGKALQVADAIEAFRTDSHRS